LVPKTTKNVSCSFQYLALPST